MTLTIDDGTFEVGNTFVTENEAEEYHESRGNSSWEDADDEAKEAALIRAFDYLSVQNWSSTAFETTIPVKVKQAQMLAALKELSSSGVLQPDVSTGVKSEAIEGAIEKEYYESGPGTIFSGVENLIRPYLVRPGRKTVLVRG